MLDVAWKDPKLAAPIVEGRPDLLAEAVIAARLEQARTVADVLLRRTRLGLLAAPQLRTAAAARPVAEAMGARAGVVAAPGQGRGRGLAGRCRRGRDRPGRLGIVAAGAARGSAGPTSGSRPGR